MSKLKKMTNALLSRTFAYKFIAYLILILFLYVFRNFLIVFFLTFIFAYLFFSVSKWAKHSVDSFLEYIFLHNKKRAAFWKRVFGMNVLIFLVYVIFITTIVLIFWGMIPKLYSELSTLHKTIPFVKEYVDDLLVKLNEIRQFNSEIGTNLEQLTSSQDFDVFIDILTRLKSVSIVFFKVILSLFLSFIFLIDRKHLSSYFGVIKNSSFSFLYDEYTIFLKR